MTNEVRTDEPLDLAAAAARWAVRVNEDITQEEREQFQNWLLADERHEHEFRAHVRVLALASALPTSTATQVSKVGATQARRRRMWLSGLAAGVLVAILGGSWQIARERGLIDETYVTRTGENRSVTFKDGSVAYLNTRTKLEWLPGSHERRLRLIEGEALFDVIHDPDQPFRVLLDNSEIQVLGTRFDVYRKKDGETIVTVLEGTVEVRDLNQGWKRRLTANERIAYQSIGLTRDVQATNASNAVKWRDGVLQIEDEPLSEVLEELSRYTDKRLALSDPRLARVRVVGAVSVRDVSVALQRIAKLAPVAVSERGNAFTLDYQPKPGDPLL